MHIFVAAVSNVLLKELTKKTVGNIHEISEHSRGDDTCVLVLHKTLPHLCAGKSGNSLGAGLHKRVQRYLQIC